MASNKTPHLFSYECYFHSSIQCSSICGSVVRNRAARAESLGSKAACIYTVSFQPGNDRAGTVLRERLVGLAVSLIVRVASDHPTRIRVVLDEAQHRFQRWCAVRSQLGGIGGEMDAIDCNGAGLRDRLLKSRRDLIMAVQENLRVSTLPGHDIC